MLNYVVASDIQYVADWVGMAGWVDRGNAAFNDAFEVIVADRKKNLAVLRRKPAAG